MAGTETATKALQHEGEELGRYHLLPSSVKAYFLILSALGIGLVVYYMLNISIISGLVLLDVQYHYLIFGMFGSTVFLILPRGKKIRWWDYAMAGSHLILCLYFASNGEEIALVGWVPALPVDVLLGAIFILLILEGCRRAAGLSLPIVAVIAGMYPLVADRLPGMFTGVPHSWTKCIAFYIFGGEGIRGVPAQVMGDIMMGFLIFAGVLISTGAGKFFIEIAFALLGKYRGGPAKVAVIASAFFGSFSGSIAANVVGTGSFTIPMMKRLGYPPHYAGAVEAVASTGGAIMPPVMGVTAFVMASLLNIPYYMVATAAILPAVLYYFGLLVQADAFAAKSGMKGLPEKELPPLRPALWKGWPFLLVLGFLIWGLLIARMETSTPFYAALLAIVISFLRRGEDMMTFRKFTGMLEQVGGLITTTMAIMLPVGILIAGISVTGVGAAFASGAVSMADKDVYLIVLTGVLACYVMGMVGIMVAAYVFLGVTMAPALVMAGGMNQIAVHLFILYYATLSMITPPVAGASFVAAAVAQAPAMKTSITSMRLGVAVYFVPFFFLFNPCLVFQGPLVETAYVFAFCLIGIFFLGAGLEGYLLSVGRLRPWERVPLCIGGFLIAEPSLVTTLIGAVLVLIAVGAAKLRRRAVARF